MTDKLKQIFIDILAILIVFAAAYWVCRSLNRETQVIARTIEIILPGRTDTVAVPAQEGKPKPTSKDSTKFWKGKYDSLQTIIAGGDSTQSPDSTFAKHFLPYQIIVRDSLTTNYVTISPLAPAGTRARIDSTRYDTLKIAYTYLDTTIVVISGTSWKTYTTVGAGAVLGASIGNIPGAGIGAIIGLLINDLF